MHAPLRKWGGMQWKVEIGTKCQTDALLGRSRVKITKEQVSFVRCMSFLSRSFFQSLSYNNICTFGQILSWMTFTVRNYWVSLWPKKNCDSRRHETKGERQNSGGLVPMPTMSNCPPQKRASRDAFCSVWGITEIRGRRFGAAGNWSHFWMSQNRVSHEFCELLLIDPIDLSYSLRDASGAKAN